jgi:hypothetical protein
MKSGDAWQIPASLAFYQGLPVSMMNAAIATDLG